jgi:hypothetical protein
MSHTAPPVIRREFPELAAEVAVLLRGNPWRPFSDGVNLAPRDQRRVAHFHERSLGQLDPWADYTDIRTYLR